jgi:hypothetical protein
MIQIYKKITDHFDWDNFECACCGELFITQRFYRHVELIEKIRTDVGWPIGVNSGHRCKRHNEAVGGEEKSEHLIFATDLTPIFEEHDTDVTWEAKRKTLYDMGLEKFDGVGLYDWGVHYDLRGFKAKWDRRKVK